MQPSSKIDLERTNPARCCCVRSGTSSRPGGNGRRASSIFPRHSGSSSRIAAICGVAHCYQWNESGYHRDMGRSEQNLDLDIAIFERLLEETRPVKSRLYLWGGEPLVHREIERILELLEQDPRETTICTNAHFIGKHIDALCRISENLEF